MKSLHINLKPDSVERKSRLLLRQLFTKIIAAQILFWIIILVVNYAFSLQNSSLKQRISKIEDEWKGTEPLLKERDYLNQSISGYSALFDAIKGVFKKDLSWHSVLMRFRYLIPEEIWFTEINLREEAQKRILDINASVGYLRSDEEKLRAINNFLEAAKKDSILADNFQVPDLQDVSKTKVKEEDVLSLKFSLTLR